MYDRKKIRSAQNVMDVSFFVVYDGEPMPWKMNDKPTASTTPSSPPPKKET